MEVLEEMLFWLKEKLKKINGLLQVLSKGKFGKPFIREKIDYIIDSFERDSCQNIVETKMFIDPKLEKVYEILKLRAFDSSYNKGRRINLSDSVLDEVFSPIREKMRQDFFSD